MIQTKELFDGLHERVDVPGRSLWAVGGFDSDFAKYVGVVAIPKYVMLDNKGGVLMVGSLESVARKCAELFNWGLLHDMIVHCVRNRYD